jgi:transglutaminase/protease-like cytokinesis protein 3
MNEISKLSKEITKDMTSDEEKIRAIYSWITTNIKYDNDTLNARLASTDSPDALNTFNKRK